MTPDGPCAIFCAEGGSEMKVSASILLLLLVATAPAITAAQGQDEPPLRQVMAPNFERMRDMLYHILVDEDYAVVLEDTEHIVEHARFIRARDPVKGMPENSYFQNYATFLEAHATSLGNVAKALLDEDVDPAHRQTHLRPQAAMHFGQIVTMCVSCHNRFRPVAPTPQ